MFTIKEESAGVPICISNAFQALIEQEAQDVQAERDAAAQAKQAAQRDEARRQELEDAQSAAETTSPRKHRSATSPTNSSSGGKAKDKLKKSRSTEGKRGLFRRKTSNSSVSSEPGDDKPVGTFLTKYFGEVGVDKPTGVEEVHGALAKLRTEHEDRHTGNKRKQRKMTGQPAVLIVTSEGLKVIERTNDTLLANVFIKDVTFTTAGVLDKRRDFFAFIAVDVRVDRRACYLFELLKGKGEAVCKTVARAFDTYAKAYKSGDEAFLPTSVKEPLASEIPPELAKLQVDRSRLNALKVLGAGMYGKVFLADETQADGSIIQRAVKLLRKSSKQDHTAAFLSEAQVMAELRHPNLVNIVGVAVERKPWLCVLEFMQYGDVCQVLQTVKERGFELFDSEYHKIGMQVCEGMEFITSQGFVHMDLAARNCLLHQDTLVKIADFGLTRRYDEGKDYWLMRKTQRLAVKWIPPDALQSKRFGEPTDVWALGVFLWELYSMGKTPYSEFPVPEVPGRVTKGYRLARPDPCPEPIYDLMLKMWASDLKDRPTFTQIKRAMFEYGETAQKMPIRDVGELLNAKLTKDIRRLSVKVQRESVRRRKSTTNAARAAAARYQAEQADKADTTADNSGETASATADAEASSPSPPPAEEVEEDLRRRSFVADKNARLKLKASVRRKRKDKAKDVKDGKDDDQPEVLIEGVLVLAEEAVDEDEIDHEVDDDNDDSLDSSRLSSAASSSQSLDVTRESTIIEEAEEEPAGSQHADNSSLQSSASSAAASPAGSFSPMATETSVAVAGPVDSTSTQQTATLTPATGGSKSLAKRLGTGKDVELTEEEKQRFIKLGLMADPEAAKREKEMERSRIYNALNPALLYSGQAANTNADVRGVKAHNYAETQHVLGGQDEEEEDDSAWDQLDVDQEFEDDDDNLDIDDIPDFGDFEAVLNANRAEREAQAEDRRRQLRELYLAQNSEELKKQEYILIKIKTQKEEEQARREAEKEAVVKSTMKTLADMKFDFSFSESTTEA
eukprot:TRINITY_DN10008_c0_g1_i1.p1 TRINITY_DN10008_c0_g1~~TRINITY_DN10008_c0_g1_i1.p1  ORF type:complete len:1147 (+),score=361.22 TRINITY_DN10008_c0_g1_i1:385-3441(+)